MHSIQFSPQLPRALCACPISLGAVSRNTVAKAAAAVALLPVPQDLNGLASASASYAARQEALMITHTQAQATVRTLDDLHSMPGPATIATSSGTDFIDYIVGMDAVEAEHRLCDAQTFRTLVLGVTTAAAGPSFHHGAPSAAAELLRPATPRSGALNLKQLTAFRDHVTRNLAPTVAHGFATAATAMRRGGSAAGRQAIIISNNLQSSGPAAPPPLHHWNPSHDDDPSRPSHVSPLPPQATSPTVAFVRRAANSIVPIDSLVGLRSSAAAATGHCRSLMPSLERPSCASPSSAAAPAPAAAPAADELEDSSGRGVLAARQLDGLLAAAAGPLVAPSSSSSGVATTEYECGSLPPVNSPFLYLAPLVAALARDEVRAASVSSSSTASAPPLQPPRQEAVAVAAAVGLQGPTAATVTAGVAATSASAAAAVTATATAAPDRRGRRGSHRAVRVGDAGRRGAAGTAASGATGPSWL